MCDGSNLKKSPKRKHAVVRERPCGVGASSLFVVILLSILSVYPLRMLSKMTTKSCHEPLLSRAARSRANPGHLLSADMPASCVKDTPDAASVIKPSKRADIV